MKVLVLTPYLPHSRVAHGGGTAVRDLIAALARKHQVQLVGLVRPGEQRYLADVSALGVEVVGIPFLDRTARGQQRFALLASRLGAAGRAVVDRYPWYVAKYGAPSLVRAVTDAVEAFEPDVVQIEYLQMALVLRTLRRRRDARVGAAQPRPRLVLNSHELSSLPRRRRAQAARSLARQVWWRAAARTWERLQVDASRWADATLCVTPQDHALFARLGGTRLHTLPLGVDTRAVTVRREPQAPPQALFVGSFQHPPNRAAANLLVKTLWPRLRQEWTGWTLVLAGQGSDDFARGIAPDVRGLGYVDDLAGVFAESRLFLAPLFEGGGIKIKILEAMARGIPVVTTTIGAEGITDAAAGLVWLADDADGFVREALAAAASIAEAERRAERARRHIEEHFSWEAIADQLTEIYAGL